MFDQDENSPQWRAKAQELHSEGVELGEMVEERSPEGADGAVYVLFNHGLIVSRRGGSTTALWGPLYNIWREYAAQGRWYVPLGDAISTGNKGGLMCWLQLPGATESDRMLLSHHSALGTFVIAGEILEKWEAIGQDVLGYPSSRQQALRTGELTLSYQFFRGLEQDASAQERESVILSWCGGTFYLHGMILQKWMKAGGQEAWWPLGDVSFSRDGSTRVQHFLNPGTGRLASICSNAETGMWWVTGSIRDKWYQLGAGTGSLGLPVEDERVCSGGEGHIQSFRLPTLPTVSGSIACHPRIGTFSVHGEIHKFWAEAGYESEIGLPECDILMCGDGRGCYSQFRGKVRSRIYLTKTHGAVLIRDPFFSAWYALGAERGSLSYPVSAEEEGPTPGSSKVRFENGTMLRLHDGRIEVSLFEKQDLTNGAR
jgi:uncharacterized protein with LGFP repeats